jgi:hypothetical protein
MPGIATTGAIALCTAFALSAVSMGSRAAHAQDALPPGDEVARRINARDAGAVATRKLVMEIVEKDGTTRTRSTRAYRRRFDADERSILFFDAPANVQGTSLLTWNYDDASREDAQWLYLPALRKSRRIALSDRGRAFLGTDLSFEDMKNETHVSLADYRWESVGEEEVDGHRCIVVDATPVDSETARALGYGRLRLRVDATIWMPRFIEYWEPGGAPLKTVRLRDVEQVDGIWSARRIEAENLQTGHRTVLRFEEIDHGSEVPEELFTEAAMRRGAP